MTLHCAQNHRWSKWRDFDFRPVTLPPRVRPSYPGPRGRFDAGSAEWKASRASLGTPSETVEVHFQHTTKYRSIPILKEALVQTLSAWSLTVAASTRESAHTPPAR